MGPEILRVTLKINDACQRAKYLVTVTFGSLELDHLLGAHPLIVVQV